MVVKTFERFLRYETGLGYEDFWNLYGIEEGEATLKGLFAEWVKKENPSEPWQMAARFTLKNSFGYEI